MGIATLMRRWLPRRPVSTVPPISNGGAMSVACLRAATGREGRA